jgi:Cu/Ag efflux protein CusF
MSRHFISCTTALLAALSLVALTSCTHKKADEETAAAADMDRATPSGVATVTAQTTATVVSLDQATRTVTLRNTAGELHTYKCGPDVINLGQVKVGDQVDATVTERLAVFVGKGGGTPSGTTDAAVLAAAPKGDKPGVALASGTQVVKRVVAVDAANHTVTIQHEGRPQMFRVRPGVDLSGVRPGDDLVVQYSESLSVVVQKPA